MKHKIGLIGQDSFINSLLVKFAAQKYTINLVGQDCGARINNDFCLYSTISEAAFHSTLILIQASDGPELENIVFGKNGIAQSNKNDLILIDMSMSSPELILELAEMLEERNMSLLDAVIVSGVDRNANAINCVFVGGDSRAFDSVLPVLLQIEDNVKHIGVHGSSRFYRQAFAVRKKQ